jgi:hypothetical protein
MKDFEVDHRADIHFTRLRKRMDKLVSLDERCHDWNPDVKKSSREKKRTERQTERKFRKMAILATLMPRKLSEYEWKPP